MNETLDSQSNKKINKSNITVAEYVSKQVQLCGKSQMEIAAMAGFNKPNIITMIKQGKTKLPLSKVGPMARALGVDAAYLFQLTMQEYEPETWEMLRKYVFKTPLLLTENEVEIIETIRQAKVSDPKVRTDAERRALIDVISTFKSDNEVAGD